MSLEIRWTAKAEREASRLDPPINSRVLTALENYATTGDGDVRHLTDYNPPQFRLRVGGWRVRFTVDREANVLYVLGVQPRGRAYR
jgi:mRNA-degrading endonuclease RelE of RelBE toxin-antitoxin system